MTLDVVSSDRSNSLKYAGGPTFELRWAQNEDRGRVGAGFGTEPTASSPAMASLDGFL